MASVKNWEAQAKTNSILASSLKSLEARVDDLSTLMEWRHAVDGRFDEVAEQFLALEDTIEELRSELEETGINLKMQMEKVNTKAKAGIFGSMFVSKMSFKRGATAAEEGPGDEASRRSVNLMMSSQEESGQHGSRSTRVLDPGLTWRDYVKANWLKIVIWTMLGLQVVAALPFIAEPFLAADVTARFVSGTLGLSLLASATAGFYATFADYSRDDYQARKAAMLGFLSLQTWVIAVGAIHMQASAREAVKLEQYCNIDKWSSSFLGMDTASGCDRDRYWAQLKVLFGMGAVTTACLLTWCFMSLRAKMESDEITHV
eukprot:jgi/Tetstr1/427014/TSEL_017219.t1